MARRTEVTGVVVELLPSALFRVALDDANQVLAHIADSPRKNFVRLLAGDRVQLELSPRDRTRGRITRRLGAA